MHSSGEYLVRAFTLPEENTSAQLRAARPTEWMRLTIVAQVQVRLSPFRCGLFHLSSMSMPVISSDSQFGHKISEIMERFRLVQHIQDENKQDIYGTFLAPNAFRIVPHS